MGKVKLAAAALAVAFSAVGLNACKGVSPSSFHEQMESNRRKVITQVVSCNVAISYGDGLGSGVVYRKNGNLYALTAAHVVADEKQIVTITPETDKEFSLSLEAQTYATKDILVFAVEENTTNVCYACKAEMVLVLPDVDVAILKLVDIPEFLGSMGNSTFDFSIPDIGERVYAVGNSSYEVGTLSTGIVQHGNRKPMGKPGDMPYIQSDCSGGPGMSGGGIFLQSTGECIGIISMKNSSNNSLYAVPMCTIRDAILNSKNKELAPE
jgi:S1-C subfamily serine protease